MNHRPVPWVVFLIVVLLLRHFLLIREGKGGSFEVGCIEDEAMPLWLFPQITAHWFHEGLTLNQAHPAGYRNEAFALFEIGNGACHCLIYYLYSIFLQRISSAFLNPIILSSLRPIITHLPSNLLTPKSYHPSIINYRQYFKLIMLVKAKYSQEHPLRETQKQQINDMNRQKKAKQPKKKIPLAMQINSVASGTSKRTHKQSKSTIEPNEHRHYNSPILNYNCNDNIQSYGFSFTHILQQNLKNQQSSHNLEISLPSPVTNFQINENSSTLNRLVHRGKSEKQSLEFSNPSLSREKPRKDGSQLKRNSYQTSQSKSPMRLVNANKLSNTPKIKQYKKSEQTQRTFKQLLENKENEDIKLQCSEKLFKYLEAKDIRSINEKILFNGSTSKSNLLSTGAINFSQRGEHEKIPSELIKTSKDNISNKSVVESSCNQIKEFFQESSSDDVQLSIEDRAIELKNKIIRSNQELDAKINKDQITNFSTISSLLQTNHFSDFKSNSLEAIGRLKSFKSQLLEAINEIVSKATNLSLRISKDIDECITSIQQSCVTGVDWLLVQKRLNFEDSLFKMQCQNDILMERVNVIEQELANYADKRMNQRLYMNWQAELNDINSQITINPLSPLREREENLLASHHQSLHSMEETLKQLRISIEKFTLFKK